MRKPINCRSSSTKMTTSSVWVCYTLDVFWGPHTINWFASHLSTQPFRFCGQFWFPGCEGVELSLSVGRMRWDGSFPRAFSGDSIY